MSKLFTVAGTSVLNGEKTYRFANTMDRVKGLEKSGHTEVELMELPEAMTKEAAVEFLTENGVTAELKSVTKTSAPAKAPVKKAVAKPVVKRSKTVSVKRTKAAPVVSSEDKFAAWDAEMASQSA